MIRNNKRWFAVLAALMLMITGLPASGVSHTSFAQGGSRTFPETGKKVGGEFLDYWNTHGALQQQGFPISNEFTEVSDLNGQPYRVQYFERAVFEFHPENPPPYNVLLSQLGTFRYRAKYLAPKPPTNTPVPQPPPPPAATNTPTGPQCDTSGNRNGTGTPSVVKVGQTIIVIAHGFQPGE